MVRKYRFRIKIHIISVLVVAFLILLYILSSYTTEKSSLDVIYLIGIIMASFGFVVNLLAYYSIEQDGIRLKSIIKSTKIKWSEILYVKEQSAGKLVGLSIAIVSKDKKINITPWTKDYKVLLGEVVMNYKNEESACISQNVLELL